MSTTHRLGDLVDLLRGRVPANTVREPEGPRFFGIAEITACGNAAPRYVEYNPEIVDNAVELREGDIAMALMSNIGDATLIDASAAGAVLGRECVALRITAPQDVLPAWLSAWLTSEEFQSQVAIHTTGSTMPTAFVERPPDVHRHRPADSKTARYRRTRGSPRRGDRDHSHHASATARSSHC